MNFKEISSSGPKNDLCKVRKAFPVRDVVIRIKSLSLGKEHFLGLRIIAKELFLQTTDIEIHL